eukprot:m.307321 g.307321  ORF g.307321 m.307321 type:complete len:334 (-) comp19628_c1_seq4:25-1026(-)
MSRYSEGRIYVGNLPRDIREKELDDLFYKYGRITDISIKSMGHGPAFAFVTFEDSRDADEAIRGRQGYDFADGCRLRVEPSNGGRGGGGGRDSGRSFTGRRSDFRVSITGLPRGSSWQDVKDFCREAGDVLFTDIEGEGRGVVEFAREDDMKWALRHLDGKEFRSHTREYSTVHLSLGDGRGGGRDDRRSRSRSRSGLARISHSNLVSLEPRRTRASTHSRAFPRRGAVCAEPEPARSLWCHRGLRHFCQNVSPKQLERRRLDPPPGPGPVPPDPQQQRHSQHAVGTQERVWLWHSLAFGRASVVVQPQQHRQCRLGCRCCNNGARPPCLDVL